MSVQLEEASPALSRPQPTGPQAPDPGWRTRGLLGAGGILLALATILSVARVVHNTSLMMSTRAEGIRGAQAVLDHGGPPLAALYHGQYVAVAGADDPGFYFYLSELGHLTGISDPHRLLTLFVLALYGITIMIGPLVWLRVTGSVRAAVMVAPALAFLLASFGTSDLYWIVPWAYLTALPLVFILIKDRHAHVVPTLVAVGLIASFASSIRSGAGLPIAIAVAAGILIRPRGWLRRVALLGVFAVAFAAITPIGFAALRSYRNHEVHIIGQQGSAHPLWHSAYIGLGFLPNRWGIRYTDEDGMKAAVRVSPDATYGSPKYGGVLRRLFFRAISDDPAFFVKETSLKGVAAVGHSWLYLAAASVVAALLAAFGRLRATRPFALVVIPALLVALVAPLLTMPYRVYEMGLYGAVGLLALIGIAELAQLPIPGGSLQNLRPTAGWRVPAVLCVGSVLLLVGFRQAAATIDHKSAAWQAKAIGRRPLP